jgi:hydrogenase expression/formation protein HypD
MKYLHEYRDPELVHQYLRRIEKIVSRDWVIMEFCGGQTHSLVKNGIIDILPDSVKMVHGPGCPVCVTPLGMIDRAIELAVEKEVILCSFGDMLRVPGSRKSLLEARAEGASVRFFYSPMEAVELAREIPDKEVVFFAVGFETTAPANALSVLFARKLGLRNYSVLSSHVLVPPAISAVIEDEHSHVDGFLGAGNVCSVMGLYEYEKLVEKYRRPLVVTGFEPVDLLQGIFMTLLQLERGEAKLENQYKRVVPFEGNPAARKAIEQVFELSDREWRGIGTIPDSGWKIRLELAAFDAAQKFDLSPETAAEESTECIAGQILKGIKKPADCPHFGKKCTPSNPLGAPMVSSEGACAAYYHFSAMLEEVSGFSPA